MSAETIIQMKPDLGAVLPGLKPDVLRRAIARGMNRGTLVIAGKIQTQRLSGKGPFPVAQHKLGVKTGTLRKSVRPTLAQTRGDEVVTSIGSAVRYAAVHEFGFTGTVPVKAHEVTMKKLFGRKLKEPLRFSRLAHQRKVNTPARAPFQTGIEEHAEIVEREITREVVKEFQGGGARA